MKSNKRFVTSHVFAVVFFIPIRSLHSNAKRSQNLVLFVYLIFLPKVFGQTLCLGEQGVKSSECKINVGIVKHVHVVGRCWRFKTATILYKFDQTRNQ